MSCGFHRIIVSRGDSINYDRIGSVNTASNDHLREQADVETSGDFYCIPFTNNAKKAI